MEQALEEFDKILMDQKQKNIEAFLNIDRQILIADSNQEIKLLAII